jgi:hypothetical protein
MTADVRAAMDMLVNEAGGYPPTAAELEAIPDAEAIVDAALKRMVQLEKVAEVARRIRAETVLDLPHLDDDLTAVLAELDAEKAP